MLQFLINNLGTICISAGLTVAVILIIIKLVKDKKSGKGCGCGCQNCSRSIDNCHLQDSTKQDTNPEGIN
ncbi:MAG: FeoB-associated Cys-rich membrane protein [Bacillota bacterium]|jgi:hypothetical protein